MDDCPACFLTPFPSTLESPQMVILNPIFATMAQVLFGDWMDETVTPVMGSFTVLVDGVSRVITSILWGANNELQINYTGPGPILNLRVTLDVTDANLRNRDGVVAVAPQTVFNVV